MLGQTKIIIFHMKCLLYSHLRATNNHFSAKTNNMKPYCYEIFKLKNLNCTGGVGWVTIDSGGSRNLRTGERGRGVV